MHEDLSLVSKSGHKMSAVLYTSDSLKPSTPAILFVHGWTSEKERSYQYAEALTKLGYVCLLFDMRGHGESEGTRTELANKDFLDDVLTAYDYLADYPGVDKNNISTIGSSFGGFLVAILSGKRNLKNLVLRAPAEYPNEDWEKVKGSSTSDEVRNWRKLPKNPNETFALEALSKFDGNVLVIESEKDDHIPHQTIVNFMNALADKNKVTHVLMKDAPHSIKAGKFRDEVTRILVDWFKSK